MKKISQLDPAQPLTGAELLEVVQNGGNYSITASQLKGKDGLSAYELAVQGGFDGSFEQWLDSIKGRDGTRWFVTEAVPVNSLGTVDDFAIDRTTGKFYLKHASGVWIEQGVLFTPGIEDAPADSRLYARKDKVWQELSQETLLDALGFERDELTGTWLLDNGQLPN